MSISKLVTEFNEITMIKVFEFNVETVDGTLEILNFEIKNNLDGFYALPSEQLGVDVPSVDYDTDITLLGHLELLYDQCQLAIDECDFFDAVYNNYE